MSDTAIGSLGAASALDGTEIYPASQSGSSVGVTGNQIQTMVRRAGSASAGSWPVLGAGTVLTSEVAGAEEFDGQCEYFGLANSSRAVALAEYFVNLSATHSLGNNANLQQIFDATANGALTLPTGLFFFECCISMSAMDTVNSTNAQFDLLGAGTATIGNILYQAVGGDVAINNSGVGLAGSMVNQSASPGSVVSGLANSELQLSVRGSFTLTGQGTIIPSIKLQTAAAASVRKGSYFRCRCMGASSTTTCGNWS